MMRNSQLSGVAAIALSFLALAVAPAACVEQGKTEHRLYVAVPGVRNLPDWGSGVLVFDADDGHRLLRRIPVDFSAGDGQLLNVKGVCASVAQGKLYVSTTRAAEYGKLTCLDLLTEKVLWEKTYPKSGCDRMEITADGKQIYLPAFDGADSPYWQVIDPATGATLAQIEYSLGAHNTLTSLDGSRAFLASLKNMSLGVVDTKTNAIVNRVGPFTAAIRPFTVNGAGTLCYVNLNGLLGFEIGDIRTGQKLHRVEVAGFKQGPVKRHGCPSHGIGLTPDEREVWVVDAFNQSLHVFDNTVMPPKQLDSIKLHDEPGWITFSVDGRFAYPSTGEVIDPPSRKTVAVLKDEKGGLVQSEKMLEIVFVDGKPSVAGSQFGVGRKVARAAR